MQGLAERLAAADGTRRARGLAALVLALLLCWATNADAYCRLRTCNPNDPEADCAVDDDGCVTSGAELYWASSCVTFGVQADGSQTQGIDAETLERVTERAFRRWLDVDCDGEPPSIHVGNVGKVACNRSEYNESGRNANIVLFHDWEWPYAGDADTYGHTQLNFDPNTGELYDADIALNTAEFSITTSGEEEAADLESILTHEIGHFLGLGHAANDDYESTMRAGWDGEGTSLRSLSDDDAAGLCAIYPPERKAASTACEPRHGFASECGVQVTPLSEGCAVSPRRAASYPLLLALGWLAVVARRRRVTSSSRNSRTRPVPPSRSQSTP